MDVVIASGKKGISSNRAAKITRQSGVRVDTGQAATWLACWEHDGYLYAVRRRSNVATYLTYSHIAHHPEGPPGRFLRRGKFLKKPPITLAEDGRDPWDQQPGEGDRNYRQFIDYRDLGKTRSVKIVAANFGITPGTAGENLRFFRWRERARAYDAHQARQWAEVMSAHHRSMAHAHIRLSRALLTKVEARLELLNPNEITNSDFVKLAHLYSMLIRVAVGHPDRHIAVSGGVDQRSVQVAEVDPDEGPEQTRMRAIAEELVRRIVAGEGVDAEYLLGNELVLGGEAAGDGPARHVGEG